jgi:HK97 family phage major capsid protein
MAENNLTPEQVIEQIETKFNDKMNSMVTKSDLDGLKNDVESLKGLTEKSQAIETAIAAFEGKIEALVEKAQNNKGGRVLSIGEQVVEGYKSQIEGLKQGKGIELDIKADTTITGDYTGNIALSTLEAGVNRIARQVPKLRQVANVGSTVSKFVTYIQQTLASTAGWTSEAGVKTEGELKYQEVSKEVKKVAGIIKVSKEMLEDLSFVRNEINTDLLATLEDQIENSLLNGSGVGANLEGLLTFAQTFAAGSFATSIPLANISDVIRVAAATIESNKFMATHVVLNPIDVAKMQLTKTSAGEYTYPIFYVDNLTGQPKLAELTVVSTTWMAAGTFLVGDMSKSNVRMRENMNVTVGYVNDDFQRNMVSILAEARLVHYVKANDVNAFVKGVIATAITAITKP